jgi:hypothetical protein
MHKPTIGRIVHYKTTEKERKSMQDHNACNVQEVLPAVIVAVWSETTVNLQVICDGELALWKTSVPIGDDEGNWNWPVID